MKLIRHHWELDGAEKEGARLFRTYDRILGKLVKMGNEPEKWILAKKRPLN
jgi:hypothetical protein